jgi:hypothetical protein
VFFNFFFIFIETSTAADNNISINEESYGDKVFEVDAFCNLVSIQ